MMCVDQCRVTALRWWMDCGCPEDWDQRDAEIMEKFCRVLPHASTAQRACLQFAIEQIRIPR